MAVFRLLHFPSSVTCPTHQILSSPLRKPLQPNAVIPCPPLSLSLKPSVETRSLNFYQFHAPLSIRTQLTTQTSELETVGGGEKADLVEGEEGEVSKTRLLAQNVPWTSTADDLRALFEKYGTVVDIEFSMYNKIRNRGLAFVTMSSPEEALAAFSNLESYEYEGRVLKLQWAKSKPKKKTQPTPKPSPIHNLFVANLPFQARAKDLKEFFNANNGNVVSAEIIFQDNPRRSAGYGFVSFNTEKEAEAALSSFQGKEFMGRPLRVARSRRFLRQGTKADAQSDNAIVKLPDPSEKPDEI